MVVQVGEDGRRCDERCYDAKRLGCHCVCGGKNHGLGLKHALGGALDDEVGEEDLVGRVPEGGRHV